LFVAPAAGYDQEMSETAKEHIVLTPGVCGGKPRIAGHRIRVQDVVLWHEFLGQSPEEIVGRFPQLTLADVHAALAYYFDDVEQIQADIEADQQFAEQLKATTPSKLPANTNGEDVGG
jgi:uncharacterized protein (DUF433 family)